MGQLMFSWPDVVLTLGILVAALVGRTLNLPDKLIASMVAAALGYISTQAVLKRRAQKKQERLAQRRDDGREDGAPEEEQEHQTSGVIEIAPQTSGRVQVFADGRVVIGPPEERGPFDEPRDDRTPTDTRKPTGIDDDGGKAA